MFYVSLAVLSLAIASFFWFKGATLVMPFAWLELLALGAALLVYVRHVGDHESIVLSKDKLVVRWLNGTQLKLAEFDPRWVQVAMDQAPKQGACLVSLRCSGCEINVGRYMRSEQREGLVAELRDALHQARSVRAVV